MLNKKKKKHWVVMNMLIILVVAMVSWINTYVKTHQFILLKQVQFIL